MPTKLTRRSFLGSTATAMVAAHSLINRAHGADVIPGFDQTKTDYDRTKAWKPFSDRKIRVGLVGYGVLQVLGRSLNSRIIPTSRSWR